MCRAGPGEPPLPTRLVAGLFILKHMHDRSDEVLRARWLENPYYQHFCGLVDKGYHGQSDPHKFRVWISGQVRRVTLTPRQEMKRRTAIKPVIDHVKEDQHMERNLLKRREGDRINAIMDAADRNLSFLLKLFEAALRPFITALLRAPLNLQPT